MYVRNLCLFDLKRSKLIYLAVEYGYNEKQFSNLKHLLDQLAQTSTLEAPVQMQIELSWSQVFTVLSSDC